MPFETYSTLDSSLGFTGEFTDLNDLVFLRARYYSPSLGVFTSRDPFDGFMTRVMSRNGYSSYTEGNPVNYTDPSGEIIPLVAGLMAIAGTTLGGALLGFGVGGAVAGIMATCSYDWAVTGRCGCERQQQMLQVDRSTFIGESMLMGAAVGALFGAAVGSGGVFSMAAGYTSILMGLRGYLGAIGEAVNSFWRGEGVNYCAFLDLVMSAIAISAGGRMVQHGEATLGQPIRLLPENPFGRGQGGTSGQASADSPYSETDETGYSRALGGGDIPANTPDDIANQPAQNAGNEPGADTGQLPENPDSAPISPASQPSGPPQSIIDSVARIFRNPDTPPGPGWTRANPLANWYNSTTGEWLRPDLLHQPPIPPHWDYGVHGSDSAWRIFENGSTAPK